MARVRTAKGVSRYNKPIGQLISRGRRYDLVKNERTAGGIARRVAELDPETRPVRAEETPGQRARGKRGRVRERDENYRKFLRGDITREEKETISYQSPDLRAKSKRERGTVVRPRKVTLGQVRDRRATARDVRLNPLSGKYVAVPAGARRGVKGGSVAKARKVSPVIRMPEYVGKRRKD
jgi:hypothetical protein